MTRRHPMGPRRLCDYCWTADVRHIGGCTDEDCPCLCDGVDLSEAAAEALADADEDFRL